MTKILLGIAIGYICSDFIDELLGKVENVEKKPTSPTEPTTPVEGPVT